MPPYYKEGVTKMESDLASVIRKVPGGPADQEPKDEKGPRTKGQWQPYQASGSCGNSRSSRVEVFESS